MAYETMRNKRNRDLGKIFYFLPWPPSRTGTNLEGRYSISILLVVNDKMLTCISNLIKSKIN